MSQECVQRRARFGSSTNGSSKVNDLEQGAISGAVDDEGFMTLGARWSNSLAC